MKIALIAILNQNALGARYLISSIRQSGHEADLILFKLFRFKLVKRTDYKEIEKVKRYMKETGMDLVYRYTPFGNNYLPHPSPVTQKEIDLLLEVIEKNNYDVIGFSLLAPNIPIAIKLTQTIKTHFPNKKILWGGVEPTLSPEKYIQYPDMILRGEGEEALVEYLNNPEKTDIEGFWFKLEDGSIIKNPVRRLILDLDKLPFPAVGDCEIIIDNNSIREDLMNYPNFHRDCYIAISSRGCPFQCSYCVHSKLRKLFPKQKYVRQRSVENFIAELDWITDRFDFSEIPLIFHDEIFAWDIEWVKKFKELYIEKINLPFLCFCHIKFTNEKILSLLKEAGLIFPSYGIQSGSRKIIKDVYHRPYIEKEKYIEYFKNIFKIGYKHYSLDVLTECKYETEEDLKATFDFLNSVPRPYTLQLAHVVAFHNTKLYDMYQKNDFPPEHPDEKTYYFWTMLYLLTQYQEFSPEDLELMSTVPLFKKQPEILDLIMQMNARLYPHINKFYGYIEEEGKEITGGRHYLPLLPDNRKIAKSKYEKQKEKEISYQLKRILKKILSKFTKYIEKKFNL